MPSPRRLCKVCKMAVARRSGQRCIACFQARERTPPRLLTSFPPEVATVEDSERLRRREADDSVAKRGDLLPGSAEKVELMSKRVDLRQPLFQNDPQPELDIGVPLKCLKNL